MLRRLIYAALLAIPCVVVGCFRPEVPGSPVAEEAPSPPAPAVEAPASPVTESPAPEFPAGAEWAQGGPVRLAGLRGRVVVVHFWTNGCINCIHNYPAYRAWQKEYAGKDVTLIGVHTPEFDWEAPAKRVRTKARENRLTFPIVLDPKNAIWSAWGTRYWPTVFLVDKRGGVRFHWEGELHLDTAEGKRFASRIDELLAEGT